MKYRVRVSANAQTDIERLFEFLAEHDSATALRARAAIERAYGLLEDFPFSGRKAAENAPLLRELVVPFGSAGYVLLFEIEGESTVTVAAVRHQREDDYR